MSVLSERPSRADVGPYVGVGSGGLILSVLAAGLILASLVGSEVAPGAFLSREAASGFERLVSGMWPPKLSPDFLSRTAVLMWQTLQISVAATALAFVAALPIGLASMRLRGEEQRRSALGTRRWLGRWGIYYGARAFANVCRAVPELVWALVFVATLGLGPFAGVMALAVHSAGVLGKLYAEILESVDQRIVEAVRSTGASEGQVTAWARIPVTLPVLLSYTLFRWECNMRAATVVGFVGAGGIGTALTISYKLFRYDELATLILAILLLISVVDIVGQLIRSRVLDSSDLGCRSLSDRVRGVGRRVGFLARADH
ncbi:MAG: phosphonate ABC transporter, permease protein PhnE [Chloroflexota bacterium]|nr:phosphonate ABC transporter, permease protein PhnE [Chloroflexota bacterium]